MKATTILPFVAITISSALSQPQTAAIDDIPKSVPLNPRSDLLPYACTQSNILVEDQLAGTLCFLLKLFPILIWF